MLLEPFELGFFVRAIIAASLVGGLCGLMGIYIVLRGMSYIGHGLSHAIFGGAVVSWTMSVNFFIGATLWGFLSALLIAWTTRRNPIGSDAAIGIITTASFALGVAIISRSSSFTRDFEASLWGSVLGVDNGEVIAIAVVSVIVAAVFFVAYKLFLFATFDPEVAPFYGVPTGWIDTLFSLLLAGTVVVSMQVLGVTMIAAAVVIPPIVARLLTNSFRRMALLSTGIGVGCGAAGIYISYFVDVSSGASVVLLSAALFVLTLAAVKIRRRFAPAAGAGTGADGGLARLPRGAGDALE